MASDAADNKDLISPDSDEKKDDTKRSSKPNSQNPSRSPSPSPAGPPTQFPVRVFVRMRPLVGKELERQDELLTYEIIEPSANTKKNEPKQLKTAKITKVAKKVVTRTLGSYAINLADPNRQDVRRSYDGFEQIVLPSDDNVATFKTCVLPYIDTILEGGSTCFFAYGHTGSGKTHTIFGYGAEHPGMFLLFARDLFTRMKKIREDADKDVILQVRFTELYQGKFFDLLSKDKIECFVREDGKGVVHVRTDPIKGEDGKVRQLPPTSVECGDEKDLLKAVENGVGSRNVGKSTLHDKSSRSHAFLEFELVSQELIKKREELVDLDADILAKELETDPMNPKVRKMKDAREKLFKYIKSLVRDKSAPYVGGKMTFVDLAGNEYTKDWMADEEEDNEMTESKQELLAGLTEEEQAEMKQKWDREKQFKLAQEGRERAEINKSLLSLKECIRSLHEKDKKHVGFRNSKLTMYLKNHLQGRGSRAIMISNIGSSKKYARPTINTLKYTQLLAKA